MKWDDVDTRNLPAGRRMRLRLAVGGRVQGVGFRPSVFRLARETGVAGFVKNTTGGVVVEIEGSPATLDAFGRRLLAEQPPLARIDAIERTVVPPTGGESFVIEESDEPGSPETLFPVDTAVCADCLDEMYDPRDRRHRYPFINCTNCGPRFTIIDGLPYDRARTTMNDFTMDDFCAAQYADPHDRRFHAEPVSCPACGPRLRLIDARRAEVAGDPIRAAREMLAAGSIVAVKGLGGYHLACLATDADAVSRLRERKRRPAKPFALMFRSLNVIERFCVMGDAERRLITAPEAPIVLLRRSAPGGALPGGTEPRRGSLGAELAEGIAPRNGYIGAMLPYTPIHHLIMETFDVLVMTSANYTDEPLISDERGIEGMLGGVADAALVHDRRIAHTCDDSIFFVPAGRTVPIRRARGFVPEPVPLVQSPDRTILAVGGQEKGTFALSKASAAYLSPHLGDLGDVRSQLNYRRELGDFTRILDVEPQVVAHDLHPDYFTSRLAAGLDLPVRIAVQHHHAHAVSVMVEHRLPGPAVAVCFDGTGYGGDGTLWGGEFLLARYDGFERLAHLMYLPLPGGEAAIREPWRMGLMHLWNVHGEGVLERDFSAAFSFKHLPARQVLDLARRGVNAPLCSGIGRLFDAAAYLLGCGERVSYEAEAAAALEELALRGGEGEGCYRFEMRDGEPIVIDPGPVVEAIVREIARGTPREEIAAAFHRGVALLVVELSGTLAVRHGCPAVVVSGGVFQNRLLCEEIARRSGSMPVPLYQHAIVPPNDGGVSLGQLQVAAARIAADGA